MQLYLVGYRIGIHMQYSQLIKAKIMMSKMTVIINLDIANISS